MRLLLTYFDAFLPEDFFLLRWFRGIQSIHVSISKKGKEEGGDISQPNLLGEKQIVPSLPF